MAPKNKTPKQGNAMPHDNAAPQNNVAAQPPRREFNAAFTTEYLRALFQEATPDERARVLFDQRLTVGQGALLRLRVVMRGGGIVIPLELDEALLDDEAAVLQQFARAVAARGYAGIVYVNAPPPDAEPYGEDDEAQRAWEAAQASEGASE